MNTQNYGQYITEYIQGLPVNEPITTAVVADVLAGNFGMDIENAKKITNVNMKRLADKGELTRVQKGVYGKVKITPFGKLTPNADEMITGVLLREGDNTIGYITGPTLLNAVGLCSWIPKERHIATNHYRRQIPANAKIRAHKPVATVNNENALYLQMLEMFTAIEQYSIDVEKPDEVLRVVLQRNNIDNEKLILYARKHYGQKVLLKTIDVALGGIEL
jgi:predicted transcriptional regulator of viral defense system